MKILHTTSRGQVTLPKDTFQKKVEDSWQEYKDGKVVEGDELMKKYSRTPGASEQEITG